VLQCFAMNDSITPILKKGDPSENCRENKLKIATSNMPPSTGLSGKTSIPTQFDRVRSFG
jgi:hypothetical protein